MYATVGTSRQTPLKTMPNIRLKSEKVRDRFPVRVEVLNIQLRTRVMVGYRYP